MVIAAIGFRITAVPFHFYAPDVYEGGPAGVVAQLAFLPKVAGFVALARILGLVGADPRHIPFDANTQIPLLLWILAVVTMTLGNVLALLQDNVRRMLAYSSVAHGGYMLMGVVVASFAAGREGDAGRSSAGSTRCSSTSSPTAMMTVGAFAVILYLSTPERPVECDRRPRRAGPVAPGLGRRDGGVPVQPDRPAADGRVRRQVPAVRRRVHRADRHAGDAEPVPDPGGRRGGERGDRRVLLPAGGRRDVPADAAPPAGRVRGRCRRSSRPSCWPRRRCSSASTRNRSRRPPARPPRSRRLPAKTTAECTSATPRPSPTVRRRSRVEFRAYTLHSTCLPAL